MKQILIIEDDPGIQKWLTDCLQRVPYGVLLASDGNTGYELAKREDVDLVILDHVLPGKNGREICRSLRKEDIKIPILMLTGLAGETDKILTLGMGADDYLTKPFGMRELLARVTILLKRKEELDAANRQAAEFAREVEAARAVQERLFPKQLPVSNGWEFAALCLPARAVGGDYYDLFEVKPGKVLMALGDVSGKGLGAALLMSGVQATIRSRAESCLKTPLQLISEVNRNFLSTSSPETFLTLFLGILELESGRLTYVNCGHPPPLLRRPEASESELLAEGGLLLGVFDSCSQVMGSCELHPGDILTIFSDGVSEARDKEERMFGDEKLQKLLEKAAERNATAFLDEIFWSVGCFTAEAEQQDDISLLVIRRTA